VAADIGCLRRATDRNDDRTGVGEFVCSVLAEDHATRIGHDTGEFGDELLPPPVEVEDSPAERQLDLSDRDVGAELIGSIGVGGQSDDGVQEFADLAPSGEPIDPLVHRPTSRLVGSDSLQPGEQPREFGLVATTQQARTQEGDSSARRAMQLAVLDHPDARRRWRRTTRPDPELTEESERVATDVQRMRTLVEQESIALVRGGAPAETPTPLVDDDRVTRARNQGSCREASQASSDDVNLLMFHTDTTMPAPEK